METDTQVYTLMMSNMAMEYTDGLMEVYIMENTRMEFNGEKDIAGGQMEMNIAENTRLACNGERESKKKTDNYTELNMNKVRSSAEVSQQRLLIRNEYY